MPARNMVRLEVRAGSETDSWEVPYGRNLRHALLARGHTPYAPLTRRLNCGGRGLCATCGVWVSVSDRETGPSPAHWHDWLADRFSYPRLSCQIIVERDMVVTLLPEKRIWGGRWTR